MKVTPVDGPHMGRAFYVTPLSVTLCVAHFPHGLFSAKEPVCVIDEYDINVGSATWRRKASGRK